MTDWVRLWHDMPTDPKWRTIARKSGQRVGDVMAVFNFIMVNASANANERGSLSGFDVEDVATALDINDDDVRSIMTAMQGKVLDGDRLAGWERRQPKREDGTAAKRKAEWKERQQNAPEHIGTQEDAPETETETETETEVNTDVLTAKRRRVVAVKPVGISDSLWRDWKNHRKTIFTDAALEGFEREAALAGWTVEAAIREAIERGWQGFKADWVKENGNGRGNSNNRTGNGKPVDGFTAALRYVANGPPDEPSGDVRYRM